MMILIVKIFSLGWLISWSHVVAQEDVSFDAIRDILKNDQLESQIKARAEEAVKEKVHAKKKTEVSQNIPNENEVWSFLSEYWLVKNAPILKWDFEKPDYGVVAHFEEFLQKMGYYEQRFKIVLSNSPALAHLGLPGTNEVFLILSVPFIKQLNLSLPEISLLLFEDFLRVKEGIIAKKIMTEEAKAMLGNSMQKPALVFSVFKTVVENIDKIAFEKGFNFQEQFDITRKMDGHLKFDLGLWSIYSTMLRKIDALIKGNLLFKGYSQLYPSPEMQLRWLGGELEKK